MYSVAGVILMPVFAGGCVFRNSRPRSATIMQGKNQPAMHTSPQFDVAS
jgi:outer membrane lipoprotein-sorting protein